MAEGVRSTIFEAVMSKQIPVIYSARRMHLLRQAHEQQSVDSSTRASHRQQHISFSNQASQDRIEQDLIIGLVLRLDAFALDSGLARIDQSFETITDATKFGRGIAGFGGNE